MTRSMLRTRFLLAITIGWMLVPALSCKKKVDPIVNNNEIQATIRYKSGKEVDIHVTGGRARIACGTLLAGLFVEANHETNGTLILSSSLCLDKVGTYNNVYVRYIPGVNSTSAALYENPITPVIPNGPIYLSIFTIKILTGTYVEGAFSSMAWYQKDTILISGTYKGNILK